jgi:outer membrane protein OmpA-like peptidoglycan-associated protein
MKNTKLTTFVISFFLFGCASFSQEPQDAFLTNRGIEELSKGNFETAEANFKVALELNSNNPYTLFYLGQLYERTGRIEEAEQAYRRVIDLNLVNVSGRSRIERVHGKNLVEIAKDSLANLDAGVGQAGQIMDSDDDGVANSRDICTDTPEGATVDAKGCWVLTGVLFDSGKWEIKSQFIPALDEVVVILREKPQLKLEIQGHTDSRGSAEYNQRVSRNRAAAVMEYLVKKGIEKDRLVAVGYESSKPLKSNATPDGRAQNRRVELRVVR